MKEEVVLSFFSYLTYFKIRKLGSKRKATFEKCNAQQMENLSNSDRTLLEGIFAGGRKREDALRQLYANIPLKESVRIMVCNAGGTREDAKDIFQEALILLDRKIRSSEIVIQSSIKGCLGGIARNLWYNQNRKNMRAYINLRSLEDADQPYNPTWKSIEKKELNDQLRYVLGILSDREMKVLQLWQLSYSMKEIMLKMNLPSEGMTRRIKFNGLSKLRSQLSPACVKKLRSYIKEG